MTKAELKRRLTPGTKLRLVLNLHGWCGENRTVARVTQGEVILATDDGRESWLHLGKGVTIEDFAGGFQVKDVNLGHKLAYEWADEPAGVDA